MPRETRRKELRKPVADFERATAALEPTPQRVERVVHGQRVTVKVYPPVSDPAWSDWLRSKVREPLTSFGIGEHAFE
jgi:hypothetical protein